MMVQEKQTNEWCLFLKGEELATQALHQTEGENGESDKSKDLPSQWGLLVSV